MSAHRPFTLVTPQIRAALDSKLTQLRAIMAPQPYTLRTEGFGYPTAAGGFVSLDSEHCLSESVFGIAGDTLWVRESFAHFFKGNTPSACAYLADAGTPRWRNTQSAEHARSSWKGAFKSASRMPRWASRLTLEVVSVTTKPMHVSSEEECLAQGFIGGHESIRNYRFSATPREHYKSACRSAWGKTIWERNPWMWVATVRRVEGGAA